MAIYRNIQLTFWTDNKIVDDFTPEDKYFYLYLFTNPQTNLCGCYEVSLNTMSVQTGYTKDTIERLLHRFEYVHNVIAYSKDTKEILLLNWHKYNWTESKDFRKGLDKQIESVKSLDFKQYLTDVRDGLGTVYTPSRDGGGTTVTVTDTITNTISNTDNILNNNIKDIIDYLNILTNSKYKYNTKSTVSKIKARLKEGFTIDDFKTVIDKKTKQWKNDTRMASYLRPETLFSAEHFESYLNEKIVCNPQSVDVVDNWV